MIHYINQFKYSLFKFFYLPLVSMIWILFNDLLKFDLGLDEYVFLLFINFISFIYYFIHFKNKIIINNSFNKIDYFFKIIPLMLFSLSILSFYLYKKNIDLAAPFASFLILCPCVALFFRFIINQTFGFVHAISLGITTETTLLGDINLFIIKQQIKNSINGDYILVDSDKSGRSIDLVLGNKNLTYILESKDFILDGIKMKLSEIVSYQELVGKNLFDMSDEEIDVLKMTSF